MDYPSHAKQLPWGKGVCLLKCDGQGLLAVEKPAGVMSHPNRKGEIGKALLALPYDLDEQVYRWTGDGAELRIHLLNRLDSATSGVVLLALDDAVVQPVLSAFQAKRVKKIYEALVFGGPRGGPPLWRDRIKVSHREGGVRSEAGAGGASAETRLMKVERHSGPPFLSLLTLQPLTGRTHQLRIQTAKRGCPIVGDRTYGDFQKNKLIAKQKGINRLCLHCVETSLSYEVEGRQYEFKARSQRPF